MVFITTINNISDISWQSVVLVEKTGLHTNLIFDRYLPEFPNVGSIDPSEAYDQISDCCHK